MGKHAIIVIKNDKNEYLQYYDKVWDSYLFLNCKLGEDFENEMINEFVTDKLKLDNINIECNYIGEKVHTKFSQSAKEEKEYQHEFFDVKFDSIPGSISNKEFYIDDIKYCWYTYDELIQDERVQEVNSDIVGYIKEFNL